MKNLDESRDDFMKQSNQIEKEIDVKKKENADTKEKLSTVYHKKVL